MTAQTIYETLRDYPVTDDMADRAARDGFLEWLITLPARNDPQTEAQRALHKLPDQICENRACQLFVGFFGPSGQTPCLRTDPQRRIPHAASRFTLRGKAKKTTTQGRRASSSSVKTNP
jgi:hypothetical protein